MIFRRKITSKLRLIAALTIIETNTQLDGEQIREIAHMGLQKCDACRTEFDAKWLPVYYQLMAINE